jgi:hypothetical protein
VRLAPVRESFDETGGEQFPAETEEFVARSNCIRANVVPQRWVK